MAQEVTINVSGMSCGHCKAAVEKALKKISGVQEAVVNLEAKNVKVAYDGAVVSVEAMKEAISDAGYQVEA